jgi:MarR family protein
MVPPSYLMSSSMMPSFDWGSMWLVMILPAVVVGAIIVLMVFLFLRSERPSPSVIAQSTVPLTPLDNFPPQPSNARVVSGNTALGEVFQSLSPSLMDDEKRVMSELVGAGGEVLQSDLPTRTSFSKATVSKVIHSLEVRGIVVRERHKWTYWCKINPRLVERVHG